MKTRSDKQIRDIYRLDDKLGEALDAAKISGRIEILLSP